MDRSAIAATLIFLAALTAITFEWVNRTKVALAGAVLVVIVSLLTEERAIAAIDWEVLGLLAGMMIIVGATEKTGIFTYIALRAAQLSRGRPLRLIFLLAFVTGILSAFLDNLTTILLVVPVTLLLADLLRISPVPLVVAEIISSNIGGTATLIGDPPNIMIGAAVSELSFLDFIVNLAPVALLTLVLITGLLYLVFRRQLAVSDERVAEIALLDPARDMRGAPNVKRTLAVLGGTIVAFFLHQRIGLEPAGVALAGATIMLVLAVDSVEEALERIEWATLVFFLGLFVMVGALEEHGMIERAAQLIADLTDSDLTEMLAILFGAGAGSAVVDNIPFTAAMIPVVEDLTATDPAFNDRLWWALALGACYGGNATMIAAAANVAATGILARTEHRISFLRFLAIGLPATLVSLLVAAAYLVLFHL